MEFEHSLNSFDYFKSESGFSKLYGRFKIAGILLEGEKYKAYFEKPGSQNFDENGKEYLEFPEDVILDFYEDYLPNHIDSICDDYIRYFTQIKIIYKSNPQALYYNINALIEDANNNIYFFKNLDFLQNYSNIKDYLIKKLEELLHDLNPIEALKFSTDFEKGKIKFNLNKSEISFLFYWLKEFKLLEETIDNEKLSDLMTQHFLRRASIDKDEYLNLKDSTAEFSKINKGNLIPSKKLLNFLKDILKKYDK